MPLAPSSLYTMVLPPAESPLRDLFSISDAIAAKANPGAVPFLRHGLQSARKFLATDKKAKSVNMIVRVANGHNCLIEVTRNTHYYFWDFTTGQKMPKKWMPTK